MIKLGHFCFVNATLFKEVSCHKLCTLIIYMFSYLKLSSIVGINCSFSKLLAFQIVLLIRSLGSCRSLTNNSKYSKTNTVWPTEISVVLVECYRQRPMHCIYEWHCNRCIHIQGFIPKKTDLLSFEFPKREDTTCNNICSLGMCSTSYWKSRTKRHIKTYDVVTVGSSLSVKLTVSCDVNV